MSPGWVMALGPTITLPEIVPGPDNVPPFTVKPAGTPMLPSTLIVPPALAIAPLVICDVAPLAVSSRPWLVRLEALMVKTPAG